MPVGGAALNVNVVPLTVYALFGSCLTFPTKTSISSVLFGHENNFNVRDLWTNKLTSYFRDLDQYDEKLEPAVREIRKADTAIKKFFNENKDIPAIVYDMDEINYQLCLAI